MTGVREYRTGPMLLGPMEEAKKEARGGTVRRGRGNKWLQWEYGTKKAGYRAAFATGNERKRKMITF